MLGTTPNNEILKDYGPDSTKKNSSTAK